MRSAALASRPAKYLTQLARTARSHGGLLLSRRYVNCKVKLRFRCAEGHSLQMSQERVQSGRWCGTCSLARVAARTRALYFAKLKSVVARRGGRILSPEYVNSQTKLRYRCASGHEWSAVPNSIMVGRWCPLCANATRNLWRKDRVARRLQRIVAKRGGTILPPGFTSYKASLRCRCKTGHTWRATPEGIDTGVWCRTCELDELNASLRKVAKRRGGSVLTKRCQKAIEKARFRCAQGHEFRLKTFELRHRWCPRCNSSAALTMDRLHLAARERGGECLAPARGDVLPKLPWRCGEGHEWKADPHSVIAGSWCPICRVRGGHSLAPLGMGVMRAMAADRGGKCLSSTYRGAREKLRWQCVRGHVWSARVMHVRKGSWCPVCSYSRPGGIEVIRAIAIEHGGRCLTRSWNDHRKSLAFRCKRGHRFSQLGNVIKAGVWCPRCGG